MVSLRLIAAFAPAPPPPPPPRPRRAPPSAAPLASNGIAFVTVAAVAAASPPAIAALAAEPAKALSLPTWAVQFSKRRPIWVTAMALVWDYGERTGLKGGKASLGEWFHFLVERCALARGISSIIRSLLNCISHLQSIPGKLKKFIEVPMLRRKKIKAADGLQLLQKDVLVMVNQVHESWTGQPVSMTKFAAAMTNGALPRCRKVKHRNETSTLPRYGSHEWTQGARRVAHQDPPGRHRTEQLASSKWPVRGWMRRRHKPRCRRVGRGENKGEGGVAGKADDDAAPVGLRRFIVRTYLGHPPPSRRHLRPPDLAAAELDPTARGPDLTTAAPETRPRAAPSHGLQGEATESGGRMDDDGGGGWRADDNGGD
ncbi:hypothetical protein OsJ_14511 [Oryza sativa Japonica Group]|uniref:Uncharacterized protein n=1 Tax=Oryza sativa subsp. japonica TaxID=39947 RepID=B9FET1_ORYSJ|nr:hypothetical protein OsJ_14511 [Oryza sativa Japonica Group]